MLDDRDRNRSDGYSCWCKPCHCAKTKAWRERNPEKAKATQEKWRAANPDRHRRVIYVKVYGIEVEEYEALLAAQGGVCAICGRDECDAVKGFLCVDHIAGTVKIRGLLCSQCNSAVGLLAH